MDKASENWTFDPKTVRIGDTVYIHHTGRPYVFQYLVQTKSPRGRLTLSDKTSRYARIEIDSLGQIVGRKPNDPRKIVNHEEAEIIEGLRESQVRRSHLLKALRVLSDNTMSASKEELTVLLKDVTTKLKAI